MSNKPLTTRILLKKEIVQVAYTAIAADGRIRGLDLPLRFEDLDKPAQSFYETMVGHLVDSPTMPHSQIYNNWFYELSNKGWVRGPVFCTKEKIHPDLRPYDELPFRTRLQHKIAHNVVLAYLEVK